MQDRQRLGGDHVDGEKGVGRGHVRPPGKRIAGGASFQERLVIRCREKESRSDAGLGTTQRIFEVLRDHLRGISAACFKV
jgi:hypothetical protein